MAAKIQETILLGRWEEKDKELSGNEGKILANWGLKNLGTILLENPKWLLIIKSQYHWNPPPLDFLKLNFDGASNGNHGKARYGFIVHESSDEMAGFGYGFLGNDMNKPAEIEGLLQGLVWFA